MDNRDIIILSDYEDSDNDNGCEASVLIVEEEDVKKRNDFVLPPSDLDEDLVVTFSRRAEVLPHARYDCPIHPFTFADCETAAPVSNNQLICEQCFCYICDKPASLCPVWIHSGVCHCNSHKKSELWSKLRNYKLLGGLQTFDLTLCEIDPSLRQADAMLQSFRQGLYAQFTSYIKGKPAEQYGLSRTDQQGLVHDYTPVYEFVSSFLDKAEKLGGRAAAIMSLGAAEYFIKHFQASGTLRFAPMVNPAEAKVVLLQRVISSVQRQMVLEDFAPDFSLKLQAFYKRLSLPAELKTMKNSLSVRSWADVLLVSVLKGQNVLGMRKDKGKKDFLNEPISVVLLRTEVLQRQRRYRELWRYLRVVVTDDSKLLGQLKDLIPFFMCMEGEFSTALNTFLLLGKALASRFTPHLFLFYLRIFKTATAPKLAVTEPTQLCYSDAVWEPIKDTVPMPRAALVKFALNLQRCCPAVFIDSQCWISLLEMVNAPPDSLPTLPEPSPQFLQDSKKVVNSVLINQNGCLTTHIHIPRVIMEVYPDQALLLLVTGALALRVHDGVLSPALPVLSTFKDNGWALEWLWDNLSSDRLESFSQEVSQEMQNIADGEDFFPLLRTIVPTLSSSTENWDHTYCSQVAFEDYSSKMRVLSQHQLAA